MKKSTFIIEIDKKNILSQMKKSENFEFFEDRVLKELENAKKFSSITIFPIDILEESLRTRGRLLGIFNLMGYAQGGFKELFSIEQYREFLIETDIQYLLFLGAAWITPYYRQWIPAWFIDRRRDDNKITLLHWWEEDKEVLEDCHIVTISNDTMK